MKKLSILSLVLLSASALTAAFVPAAKKKVANPCNGVVNNTADGVTCSFVGGTAGNCFTDPLIQDGQSSATGAATTFNQTAGGTGSCA